MIDSYSIYADVSFSYGDLFISLTEIYLIFQLIFQLVEL